MKELKFFFDPISPYAYLGSQLLTKVVKKHKNVHVKPIPVLFAGLLNAHGQKGPAEIPAKREYVFLDCVRVGQINSIPFTMPPAHPFNPLLALRALTAVHDTSKQFVFAKTIMSTCWGKGLDITNKEVIYDCAISCGLNGEELLEAANSEIVKNKLKENTDEAIAAGVFGVPTVIVDNEMFWGCDRIEHVDQYLEGNINVDYSKFRKMINIPRGSDRKAVREHAHKTPDHVHHTH